MIYKVRATWVVCKIDFSRGTHGTHGTWYAKQHHPTHCHNRF